MFFIYSMALMSFLGCKAASRYPLLAYRTTFYYVMFLSGIIKISCHWTHISRRILSLQAWIKGDTAQILSCINVMYKNPSRLLPSSHLPWRQEVFTEDIGTSLKPSCTSSNHICSIHDHISQTSPFSPSFMLSRSDHTEPPLSTSTVQLPSGCGEMKRGQANKAKQKHNVAKTDHEERPYLHELLWWRIQEETNCCKELFYVCCSFWGIFSNMQLC